MEFVKPEFSLGNGKEGRLWLALTVMWGVSTMSSAETIGATRAKVDCEAEFVQVMENADRYPDLQSRIGRMEALGASCKGTGIYESRLGGFYSQQGRYEDARRILIAGLSAKTKYNKQIGIALFDMDLRQEHLSDAETRALALIKEYPDWAGGYGALGQVRLTQHRFKEGIENFERANAIEPTSGAYTLLAMAYYQVDRPRDAAIAMQKAIHIDKNALKHTQAVCATAYSLVALGHLPEAEDLLLKHLKVQPRAANDPTYQAASALVKNKIQEQDSKTSAVR